MLVMKEKIHLIRQEIVASFITQWVFRVKAFSVVIKYYSEDLPRLTCRCLFRMLEFPRCLIPL